MTSLIGSVLGVGAVVAAPAVVIADVFLGDAAQRVIQNLDTLVHRLDSASGADRGAIELQDEARLGDGGVLLVHGVGESVEIRRRVRVVLLDVAVAFPEVRRDGADERVGDVQAAQRVFQVGDVRPTACCPVYVIGPVRRNRSTMDGMSRTSSIDISGYM